MADRSDTLRDSARFPTPIGKVLRRLRRVFVVSVVFSFAVNLMVLVSPLYMMQIYNRVLPARSESTLIMLTGLVVFALAALAILDAVRSLVFVRVGGAVERDLNEIVIDSSFANMLQNHSTSYDHALRDFDTIRQFVWSAMPGHLLDMLWVPLFVACVPPGDAGRIVSVCSAAWETETLWDVSVETVSDYRRRGLAAACFIALARWMLAERGKRPVWGAHESNPASLALAASLGFVRESELLSFQPRTRRASAKLRET